MPGGISNAASPKQELYQLTGKTIIYRDKVSNNDTQTIYEVTAGKTFYLMVAGLTIRATVDSASCFLVTGALANLNTILGDRANITATYNASYSNSVNVSFPIPVPIIAGLDGFLRIQSSVAGTSVYAWIIGWEE